MGCLEMLSIHRFGVSQQAGQPGPLWVTDLSKSERGWRREGWRETWRERDGGGVWIDLEVRVRTACLPNPEQNHVLVAGTWIYLGPSPWEYGSMGPIIMDPPFVLWLTASVAHQGVRQILFHLYRPMYRGHQWTNVQVTIAEQW